MWSFETRAGRIGNVDMFWCEGLEVLPSRFSNLIALDELDFSTYQALKHVRVGFGILSCLEILCMSVCEALEVFPLD